MTCGRRLFVGVFLWGHDVDRRDKITSSKETSVSYVRNRNAGEAICTHLGMWGSAVIPNAIHLA